LRSVAIFAGLALLTCACQKQSASVTSPPSAATQNASPSPAWTPERVREFVVDTERLLYKLLSKQLEKYSNAQATGECYGDSAFPIGLATEIVPVLETRLTGQALRCYLASYFGCRMGDWIASAGVSRDGLRAASYYEARSTILEQTPDRIVAEVGEAPFDDVLDGTLSPRKEDGKSEFNDKSRYTLIRDAKGVWRISDRIPSFKEWECREK
jgi:hypothetical protein